MNNKYPFFLLFFVVCWGCVGMLPVFAQENKGIGLYLKNQAAHASNQPFESIQLFKSTTGQKHTDFLEKESILAPQMPAITTFYQNHPNAISMVLHADDGTDYSLELLRAFPTATAPNMGIIDSTGRHPISYDAGIHYQGIVKNTQHSMAALSVFSNGEVMLLFGTEAGNFVVGKLEDGSGNYILYNDQLAKNKPFMPCGTKDEIIRQIPTDKDTKTTATFVCNKVKVYWEAAYGLFTSKSSSVVNTQNYLTGLFNEFATMYANEQIAMELKSMYIWTVNDEYPTSGSSAALNKFVNYWNTQGDNFDGDIAHFLAKDGNGNGGLAYLNVLCSKNFAYAYSDINGTFQSVPTYSWDVEVVTHESGHNLGSHHTHWCGWMTGAGATCGAIDNCTTLETTATCTSCSATNLNTAPVTAWKGTVMSYCHLVSRGILLSNGFGTLPGNLIRSKVASQSCLGSLLSASLTPTPICTGNGGITLNFNTDNHGSTPYTFNWSNNTHSQNLAAISTPGNYTINIIDGNSCTATYAADIVKQPTPGNGLPPGITMPICCNGSTIPLILNAAVPTNLTNCQTIYWLKSPAAFSSFASAKAYFDTTQSSNILPSTNSSSINTSTGASLNIMAPASCTANQTSYYTPVAVQLPHVADSFIATTNTTTGITVSGTSTVIGKYISFPDDRALPSFCDLLDTPTTRKLTITVSGYSGRTNKMSMLIGDNSGGSNLVLYEAFGLAGNGTYTISGSMLPINYLMPLKISVYDYNCPTATTCVSSTANISATRKVVYGTHPASMTVGCTIGSALKVVFSPTACTKLAINTTNNPIDQAALFPNPANNSVTLRYFATGNKTVQIKVLDLLGKVIFTKTEAPFSGYHTTQMNVSQWAKGVYLVQLSVAQENPTHLKLIVE